MAESKSDLFLLLKNKNTDLVSWLGLGVVSVMRWTRSSSAQTPPRTSVKPPCQRWSECPHLKEIAHEIPPYDPKANVEILTRREAPELLKITAGRNGPKGASWAQKLDMGWTISSQMCLNWVGGPVHISAHHTTMEHLEKSVTSCPRNVQERYAEKGEIRVNLFQ